ncbi:hypothetical protein DV735_g5538, partial [Chaetothyriales sp. CBS 134920]
MKERCSKQHRIGEVCGRKFFDTDDTTTVSDDCRLCQDIKVKTNRLRKEEENIRRWKQEGDRFKSSIAKAEGVRRELMDLIQDMESRRMIRQYQASNPHRPAAEPVPDMAANIMLGWDDTDGRPAVRQVQIADMEDAAYIPGNSAVVGRAGGNLMWRSPEAHASSRVQRPSDIFSFGVVCIYVLTKRVIFAVGDKEAQEPEDKQAIVLQCQLSYFSDVDSLVGLLQYLGDSPWIHVFTMLAEGLNEQCPRAPPFALWKDIDPEFKDLVGGMTNIDPRRRITASEALSHPWFADMA